jgi:negative regulator of flagellin synthesis FlgM
MPIDGINETGRIYLASAQNQYSNGNCGKAAAARQPDDVQVSDRNREFQRIRELVDALPEVRLDRVNRLAKSIDEGTYHVKSEEIAEAIIQKHLIDIED